PPPADRPPLSLHDALPIWPWPGSTASTRPRWPSPMCAVAASSPAPSSAPPALTSCGRTSTRRIWCSTTRCWRGSRPSTSGTRTPRPDDGDLRERQGRAVERDRHHVGKHSDGEQGAEAPDEGRSAAPDGDDPEQDVGHQGRELGAQPGLQEGV